MTNKGKPRQRRTKEMLLPLPAAMARDLSLENHLALATMRSGHGTSDTMMVLLRILYMTFFMLEQRCSGADLAMFLEAERVLDMSIRAVAKGSDWQVPEERLSLIGLVLQRYDEAVGSLPKYCYAEAWDRLNRFARSAIQSPLPGSQLRETFA